jgi:hypothetical protein
MRDDMRHDPDAMPDGMRCDPDAVPDDMRRHPAHPVHPLGKKAKKTLKKGPKGAKNAVKMGEKINYRLSGGVAEKPGGQLRPESRGAAAGRGDDGLKLRKGRGLIVVDH